MVNDYLDIQVVKFYETQFWMSQIDVLKPLLFYAILQKALGKDTYKAFSYFKGDFCYSSFFNCQVF